ncbi:unnamed protein product [Anisakis simplex]|uniref:Autophagy-related protein 9 n=1 Tax=Anisakis simplex TaxID=6269 RepID=A0A0M3J2K2_ANISI|nr:unnamed protein product [Anisakis simplex]
MIYPLSETPLNAKNYSYRFCAAAMDTERNSTAINLSSVSFTIVFCAVVGYTVFILYREQRDEMNDDWKENYLPEYPRIRWHLDQHMLDVSPFLHSALTAAGEHIASKLTVNNFEDFLHA